MVSFIVEMEEATWRRTGLDDSAASRLAAGDSDRLRLVLFKAEDAEPHAYVQCGAWTRAGRHAGGGASAIDRPRRSISLTRTSRSSARVR